MVYVSKKGYTFNIDPAKQFTFMDHELQHWGSDKDGAYNATQLIVTNSWLNDLIDSPYFWEMPKGTISVAALINAKLDMDRLTWELPQKYVTDKLKLSNTTVINIFRSLQEKGWLVKIEEASPRSASPARYRVVIPPRVRN